MVDELLIDVMREFSGWFGCDKDAYNRAFVAALNTSTILPNYFAMRKAAFNTMFW